MIKHIKYLRYIIRHKWYVFLECCKLGIPWRGLVHDLSKFLPSEWFPYAEYFYGKRPDRVKFSIAWLHHQKRNKHHWQYWILKNDSGPEEVMEMPLRYRKEMLADWIGAGRAINGKNGVGSWYSRQKDIIVLEETTRAWIENEITKYSHV